MADLSKKRQSATDLFFWVPSVASTAYEVGDLLYLNSGTATLASSQADGGTEAANQATFADNFLGVCGSPKLVSDATTADIGVSAEGVFNYPCDSTTWAVGEYVAACENAGGTGLEKQKVKKSATRADAIGECIKAGAALTEVRFVLYSRFNKPLTPGT